MTEKTATEPEFLSIARALMQCPAVAYHEDQVAKAVREIARHRHLKVDADRFGNLLVTVGRKARKPPLVLAAHMDHPGFEVTGSHTSDAWNARFLGGVPDRYFKPGVPLRLHPGNARAEIASLTELKKRRFRIRAQAGTSELPQFAVWDLPAFRLQDDRIRGRACDDLIGVAAILSALAELRRKSLDRQVIGLISRAEEVGFQGALVAADGGSIPRNSLVISLETSSEMPPVKIGNGVIIRVGDRSSVFDSMTTRYLTEIAMRIQKRDSNFKFQRALMSGGSCEGTAFQELGYTTAALCVALGNYHNCGRNSRIAMEFVSLRDSLGMVRLLAEAARNLARQDAITGKTSHRLHKLLATGRTRLRPN